MKKIRVLLSLTLAALLATSAMASCGHLPEPAAQPVSASAASYVSMRINPEIEVIADENGEVIAANAVNEDGEVVLSDLELVGMTVDEAGEAFADKSTELGYIDVDAEEATVYVDVESADGDSAEKLEKQLSDRIGRYFENKGINGKVAPETLEKYADKLDAWGLSVGQTKMVIRVLDMYPEMTEEEVLALTPAERMALLHKSAKEEKVSAALKDALKADVETLKETYAETFALGEELKALKTRLETEELTDEDRAALEAEIAEKQAAFDEQMKAFRDEAKALRVTYKEETRRVKDEHKARAEERKQANAEKLRKHEEKHKGQKADGPNSPAAPEAPAVTEEALPPAEPKPDKESNKEKGQRP